MNIVSAQWANEAQTMASVITDNGEIFVPADPANKDWQRVLDSAVEIAPYSPPAPPPVNMVKRGWLRAALIRTGKLAAVEAAVATLGAEQQDLWQSATEFRIDDPDIVAIAAALSINLRDLFDLADAIRIERQA
jgi:hypothetical protein